MPQMAIIQSTAPTAPNATSAGSSGSKEQGQFSPHLENAISSNKKQQQAGHDKNSNDTSTSAEEQILTDENSQLQETQNPKNPSNANAAASTSGQQPPLTTLFPEATNPVANSDFPQISPVESSSDLTQKTSGQIGTEFNKSEKAAVSYDTLPELPPANQDPGVLNSNRSAATRGQDALISQLQSIIDNANEAGTVSITRAENSSSRQTITNNIHGVTTASSFGNSEAGTEAIISESSEFNLKGLLGADAGGIEKATGKPSQQLAGIRNDSQQQYYNAKTNNQNLTENNQNFQGSQAGDEFSQQTTGSTLQNGSFGAVESTNTFAQISAIAQEAPSQPASELAKPILLPSGTIVYEEEIIQQLSQRFQISGKQMDSRINLKLHPEELGELKIDLTLKEGSIKANVVAQSQHTLEILEKNIPKLKTVLEGQGFTVDEISVATESESVGEFDLFDRQLFSHNDYTPTAQKRSREDESIFTLEDSDFAAPETSSGVNVKI